MKKLIINGIIGRQDDPTIGADDVVFSYQDLENFLLSNKGEKFEVVIDSPGGSVEEGFKIYNKLKTLQIDTFAITANSIASIIFLSGVNRKVTGTTEMIIHNAWVNAEVFSGEKLNVHTLNALAEIFAETDMRILDVYTSVAGKDKEQSIFAYMSQETNIGASKAKELGFATEVVENETKALSFKNRVITYSRNQIKLLNIQDGDIKTYADVVLINSDEKVLILQRKSNDDFEPNKWGFPGGKVMQGETTFEGAKREMYEETGIELNDLQKINEIVNDDESITHYFFAYSDEKPTVIPEHQKWEFINSNKINEYPLIKNQTIRFEKIINSIKIKNEMDQKDKLSTFEKMLGSLSRAFKLSVKNMLVKTSEGVELFIEGEGDQQYVDKIAYIAEDGIPTEAVAPEGNHTLADGTQITVVEGGVIVTAVEAPDVDALKAEYEEKQKAMENEKKAMEEEKTELLNKIENLTKVNTENSKKVEDLQKAFVELKNQIKGDPDTKKDFKEVSKEDFAKLSIAERAKITAVNKARNQKNK